MVWPVPELLPGQPQTLEFTGVITPDGTDGQRVENTASIGGTSASASFVIVNQPSLAASTKSVDAEPFPGGRVLYTIRVTNSGTQAASNVVVADPLPAELDFVGARPAAQVEGNTLRWAFASIPSGETRELRIEARVRQDVPMGGVS